MTEYQIPTDPAAYVVINEARIPYGGLVAMTVRTKPKHHGGFSIALGRYEGDALDMLLSEARGYARYAPGNIPSDEHIIMAALVAEGLLDDMTDPAGLGLLGEDDDGEDDASLLANSDAIAHALAWHDLSLGCWNTMPPAHQMLHINEALAGTLLRLVINDSDLEECSAAAMLDANEDDLDARRVILGVAFGTLDEGRIGGGAEPLVVITRDFQASADPMLDAAPAMLAALRAIVSGLTQAVQTCDLSGADQHRLEGAVGILRCDARFAVDRARQAIAKAEGAV